MIDNPNVTSWAKTSIELVYAGIANLRRTQGERLLAELSEHDAWPRRGVYVLFEPGEFRSTGSFPRIVRVGTHGVSIGSTATLLSRLRAHRGMLHGRGGNHRSSVFRLHVGAAIIERDVLRGKYPLWGRGQSADRAVREDEISLEIEVSRCIGSMQVLCLDIDDDAGPLSDRAYIERNLIAITSTAGLNVDNPSPTWLGRRSPHSAIRGSGMWNVNCVGLTPDPGFIDVFQRYVASTVGDVARPIGSIAPVGWSEHRRDASSIPLF